MASEVMEEIDASKGEIDAFNSMCSAGVYEDASVKDEPARLSWKPAEVKGIERRTIGMEAAGKEIDAGIPVMHDETKGLPSRSVDERSGLKGIRHERTDKTGATFGFLSDPTCFTARCKELDVGLDPFQADSIGMADEAKSFTAWGRGIASERHVFDAERAGIASRSQSGLTCCGGVAVNLGDDPLNCGACGHRCAAGEMCVRAVRVRPAALCPDPERETHRRTASTDQRVPLAV
jgi:hypothetical protein